MILKTTSIDRAREAVYDSEEDHDTILKWIVENLPIEYTEPGDLKSAYDSVSRADIFMGRIKRRQDWSLLKYATDMMSAGVALSKREKYKKFSRYQYPKTFIALAQTKKKRAVMGKISDKMRKKCHGSKGLMEREFFPVFEAVFKEAPEAASHIASQLELDREEIKYFTGGEAAAKKIEKRAGEITKDRIRRSLRSDKQASLFEFGKK
jgi:replication factor C large subunit